MSTSHLLAAKWIDADPVPAALAEAKRGECALLGAQAFLAAGCLLALCLDAGAANRAVVGLLMLVYVVFSVLTLVLVRMRTEVSPTLRVMVHVVGILWPPMIFVFTGGPSGPFFVFLVFIVFAAAYRRSFLQTVVASGMLLLVESSPIAISHIGATVQRMLGPGGLLTWVIGLLLLGCVLGYLWHEERRFRRAAVMISRVVGKTQSELGIGQTIEAILGAVVDLFSARRVVLVLMDAKGGRNFLWETPGTVAGQPSTVEFSQLRASEAERYFLAGPSRSWSAIQLRRSAKGEPLHCLVLEGAGKRTCDVPSSCLGEFLIRNDVRSLLGVTFSFGKWSGRLLVLDPSGTAAGESELRFLQALVWEVGPAVHSQYLLGHLRSRVRAAERARVARELHDGVVQSLVAVEMRLGALRRSTFTDLGRVIEAVAQAQQVVRHEILAVRELMEQIKPIDLSSKELLGCLAEIVDRFRRDTAISASFVSDFDQVTLAPRVCSELARIAQEALFNVRKHSLATNVLVRLARDEGHCKLVIEDDGRGFEFSGRFSQDELEAIRKGPRVIKERVRSIGGELVIDSIPGHGARLEISVPQQCYG